MATRSAKKGPSWLRLLLIIPFIVLLFPAIYNSQSPELFGFPFFYWFQMLWIILTALLTAVVYFVEER